MKLKCMEKLNSCQDPMRERGIFSIHISFVPIKKAFENFPKSFRKWLQKLEENEKTNSPGKEHCLNR